MTGAPPALRTSRGELRFEHGPLLMGVVNATPDSFSDAGLHRTLHERVELARRLVAAGASVIDIGGESGVTNRPPVTPAEEIARVVPLIEAVSAELEVTISVDTYKPDVADAALAAGAAIVNDVSALRDPALADVCAAHGAGLIITHTTAPPKVKRLDPDLDATIVADVRDGLAACMDTARSRGVEFESLMLDPGPDLGKTPAQTVAVLRELTALHALGRPLLLAVSRKDFVGAITGRPPRERLAGTLAAIAFGVRAGAHLLRVHDVAETAEFLGVAAVLEGRAELPSEARLADGLRWAQDGR
ncbi:MAG TPA: dihydropteroate synthase [Solirubrobacteraceae bacterium]|nr:dihydropteroate synthase [Solirubrobacteraceae bacterium]